VAPTTELAVAERLDAATVLRLVVIATIEGKY
jgi:hypothetical protein